MSAAIEITDHRTLDVERVSGTTTWHVNEFDGGRSYMLTASASSIQLGAHFDAEQWAAFQKLIAPPVPEFTIDRVPS